MTRAGHSEIAKEVRAARKRVRAVDPDAYGGFVTDAACYAVARRHDMKATDVVRAYRAFFPLPDGALPGPPRDARPVSDEGKAAA